MNNNHENRRNNELGAVYKWRHSLRGDGMDFVTTVLKKRDDGGGCVKKYQKLRDL
jgi:hypothetical protein